MILTKNGSVSFRGKRAYAVYQLLQGKKLSTKECYNLTGAKLQQIVRKLTDFGMLVTKVKKTDTLSSNGNCYEYFLSKGIKE